MSAGRLGKLAMLADGGSVVVVTVHAVEMFEGVDVEVGEVELVRLRL